MFIRINSQATTVMEGNYLSHLAFRFFNCKMTIIVKSTSESFLRKKKESFLRITKGQICSQVDTFPFSILLLKNLEAQIY
jgi:hypothetical protein